MGDTANKYFGGFKHGKGTPVAPTAADNAIDLTQVVFRITRVHKVPSLKITYHAGGPFRAVLTDIGDVDADPGSSDLSMHADVDGFETLIGDGRYTLDAFPHMNRRWGLRSGLFRNNRRHQRVLCDGARTHMPIGSNTATQSIPLTCLTGVGIRSARLRATAAHVTFDLSSKSTTTPAPGGGSTQTTAVTDSAEAGVDSAHATWRLPFTWPSF
jgi:hypothetical protein